MDDNELLSLWYGYILQDWLYFEEKEGVVEGVNVSMGGKRANSVSKEAMKAAIRVDSNPTEEERSADVFFRRTIEIPNTINADSCKIIQEAGHFTYELVIDDSLNFSACSNKNDILNYISNNIYEERNDGEKYYNSEGLSVNLDDVVVPNLTDEDKEYEILVSSNRCEETSFTIVIKKAEETCDRTNDHEVNVTDYNYSIAYEESGRYITPSSSIDCEGGNVVFSIVDGMCNGGNVTFSLKLSGFTAKLSDDNVECSICDEVITSYTEPSNVTATTESPSNRTVSNSDLTVVYDNPVDTATINIKWSDGETTYHNIWTNGKTNRPSRVKPNNNPNRLNIYPNHLR